MGAEPQEAFQDSGSEDAGKLEPSLSDVQLVEAFFDVEGRLEAALAAARHPAAAPQVAIYTTWVTAWVLGVWVVHRLPEFTCYPHWAACRTTVLSNAHAWRHAILQHVKPLKAKL